MNIEHKCCIALVEKFCANPNWPRELKIAKKLLAMCPDLDSWGGLNLQHKPNSLAFFLTPEGEILIPTSQNNPLMLDLEKLRAKRGRKTKKIDFVVNTY